jgi:hypothetical protein
MTLDELQTCSKKTLTDLARKQGIVGWHAMRKEDLIQALGKPAPKPVPKPISKSEPAPAPKPKPQKAAARETPVSAPAVNVYEGPPTKDLSARNQLKANGAPTKDRICVVVRDPFWLHACWELSPIAIQRAEAALSQDWHGAKPILRVFDVSSHDTTSTSETAVRDIEIHGGCNNWYIEVHNPPRSFRVDIGYLSRRGQFFVLARSNIVATPRPGLSNAIDTNWSDLDAFQADKLYAMSNGYDNHSHSNGQEVKELLEERLRRPLGSPIVTTFGNGTLPNGKPRKFWFKLDAELIIQGATDPLAKVSLQGEPVKLRSDGTFTMRFSLPDGRQIIPAVSISGDGVEERTIVLAVERNTKELEPMIHELSE